MVHLSPLSQEHATLAASLIAPGPGWTYLLGTLATLLLICGIDDFVPVLLCARNWLQSMRKRLPEKAELDASGSERHIAIFVPCWKEYAVIANMVRHNLAVIQYRNFDFFLGVYPNDQATSAVAEDLSRTYRNVHVAVCVNPGPTSKADCLNSIYSRMERFEAETSCYFDTVVLHDAEDLIHPEALGAINAARQHYAMVQIPVLPLPTPLGEFTHAIYCDEFAEFQTVDMRARGYSNSFIPSNGVGTGFAREILEQLAQERSQIFDPASLTEDYEIGVYIHQAGYRQIFIPPRQGMRDLVATREYFPRRIQAAIRQRTRWVTGITLQGWQRSGWKGSWPTKYWFWRDRKGLVANPLSLLTNVIFGIGLFDLAQSVAEHRPWIFTATNPVVRWLCSFTFALQWFRITLRVVCVARIYGLLFALGVPLRALYGNLINCAASVRAVYTFVRAKLRRQQVAWLKTDHAYPNRSALPTHRRDLPEVIVSAASSLRRNSRICTRRWVRTKNWPSFC